jgi:ribonuclease III
MCYTRLTSTSQWTQVEQALLANSNLSAVGFEHSLDTCIVLNMGTPSVSKKTMATTVEAVLGAVYEDGGGNALVAVLAVLGLTHVFPEVVTLTYPSPLP